MAEIKGRKIQKKKNTTLNLNLNLSLTKNPPLRFWFSLWKPSTISLPILLAHQTQQSAKTTHISLSAAPFSPAKVVVPFFPWGHNTEPLPDVIFFLHTITPSSSPSPSSPLHHRCSLTLSQPLPSICLSFPQHRPPTTTEKRHQNHIPIDPQLLRCTTIV